MLQNIRLRGNVWHRQGQHLESNRKECGGAESVYMCCSNRGVTSAFTGPQTCLWPVELFSFMPDVVKGSFGCCCVWKSEEKWARILLHDCWNVVCVCVYMCLSAALCSAADSHLSILAGTLKRCRCRQECLLLPFELNNGSIGAGQSEERMCVSRSERVRVCANPPLVSVCCSGGVSQPSGHHQEGAAEPGLRPQPVL